jgi:hypothetical protein
MNSERCEQSSCFLLYNQKRHGKNFGNCWRCTCNLASDTGYSLSSWWLIYAFKKGGVCVSLPYFSCSHFLLALAIACFLCMVLAKQESPDCEVSYVARCYQACVIEDPLT